MSVWFKSRLNPWYIWIPSNPNLYSTKIIMKMRWQTIASNVSIRTISPTATPLPKANDCVAVYIAGRRTSLVVYGWWPQPPTKNTVCSNDPWTLQWPRNERLKSPALWLFTQSFIQTQIKETLKLRVTGLCAGNSPGTGEFPAQMASYAEKLSIWWRHHEVDTKVNISIVYVFSSSVT